MLWLGMRRSLFVSAVLTLLLLAQSVSPLYFYFEAGQSKCFMEELPVDTIVVGHYLAEEWSDKLGHYDIPTDLNIGIVVKHVETNHILVSSQGPPEGKFAFSSHDHGDHEICIMTEYHGERRHNPEVRMHLDVIIGDSHRSNAEADRQHTFDLLSRTQELNAKVRDLRKEQQYQREREAEFRKLSDQTFSRAFWWIIIQALVLIGACVWQLSTLRVCTLSHAKRTNHPRLSLRTKSTASCLVPDTCTALRIHFQLSAWRLALLLGGRALVECRNGPQWHLVACRYGRGAH